MKRVGYCIVGVLGVILLGGCNLLPDFSINLTPVCEDEMVWNFVDAVHQLNERAFTAFGRIAELINHLETDPTLLDSDVWLDTVNEQVQLVLLYAGQAERLEPPRREFRLFVELMQRAYQDFSQAIQVWQTGIVTKDQQIIDEGLGLLDIGHAKLASAAEELELVMKDCLTRIPPDEVE